MAYTPNYTADPTDADLAAFLTACGVYTPQVETFNVGFVAGALSRFKRSTGRYPFLAEPSDTFLFDPPGVGSQLQYNQWKGGNKILELMPCFLSISAINVGVSTNDTGSPVDMDTMVYLRPYNASKLGLPITWLEFLVPVIGLRQSVSVTGVPGSFTSWPVDAWNAVLMGAAAEMSAIIGISVSGGTTQMKEADVSQSFDSNPMAVYEAAWRKRFTDVIAAYKLLRVGL